MNNIQKLTTMAFATTFLFAACKKDDKKIEQPQPEEQELITTIKLVVKDNAGFNKSFSYKVDNGFNNNNPGTPVVDNLELSPNKTYQVEVLVLNEAENPAEDITVEVKEESHHHLFLYKSMPATGAGSLKFSNGSKDDEGNNFNQAIELTTGEAGTGSLTVTLKHEPANKNAATADEAGGETDAEAIFPVMLK